jgi:hypothetical protein
VTRSLRTRPRPRSPNGRRDRSLPVDSACYDISEPIVITLEDAHPPSQEPLRAWPPSPRTWPPPWLFTHAPSPRSRATRPRRQRASSLRRRPSRPGTCPRRRELLVRGPATHPDGRAGRAPLPGGVSCGRWLPEEGRLGPVPRRLRVVSARRAAESDVIAPDFVVLRETGDGGAAVDQWRRRHLAGGASLLDSKPVRGTNGSLRSHYVSDFVCEVTARPGGCQR